VSKPRGKLKHFVTPGKNKKDIIMKSLETIISKDDRLLLASDKRTSNWTYKKRKRSENITKKDINNVNIDYIPLQTIEEIFHEPIEINESQYDLENYFEYEDNTYYQEEEIESEEILEKFQMENPNGIIWKSMIDYESFNLYENLLSILKLKYLKRTLNSNKPLYDGANITSNDFNDKLRSFIAHADLTEAMIGGLRNLFKLSLPVDALINNPVSTNENQREHYIDKPIVFNYDCCLCGDTVYEGLNRNLNKCKVCPLYRYTDNSNRYPIATINYRPITSIICELLETDSFHTAIRMFNEDIKGQGIYNDISASEYSKSLMEDMHKVYENKLSNKIFGDYNVTEISLLLGLSYDGAQIYHYATTNFWPMFISILNLPPELRKTLGKGTFMVSLFTSKSGSMAEEFIFHKCLVEELLKLNEGITLYVHNSFYHIQARLCIIGVDSKALETVTYTQGTGSHAGCPLCRLSPG
jgi:hypothetical protein